MSNLDSHIQQPETPMFQLALWKFHMISMLTILFNTIHTDWTHLKQVYCKKGNEYLLDITLNLLTAFIWEDNVCPLLLTLMLMIHDTLQTCLTVMSLEYWIPGWTTTWHVDSQTVLDRIITDETLIGTNCLVLAALSGAQIRFASRDDSHR